MCVNCAPSSRTSAVPGAGGAAAGALHHAHAAELGPRLQHHLEVGVEPAGRDDDRAARDDGGVARVDIDRADARRRGRLGEERVRARAGEHVGRRRARAATRPAPPSGRSRCRPGDASGARGCPPGTSGPSTSRRASRPRSRGRGACGRCSSAPTPGRRRPAPGQPVGEGESGVSSMPYDSWSGVPTIKHPPPEVAAVPPSSGPAREDGARARRPSPRAPPRFPRRRLR